MEPIPKPKVDFANESVNQRSTFKSPDHNTAFPSPQTTGNFNPTFAQGKWDSNFSGSVQPSHVFDRKESAFPLPKLTVSPQQQTLQYIDFEYTLTNSPDSLCRVKPNNLENHQILNSFNKLMHSLQYMHSKTFERRFDNTVETYLKEVRKNSYGCFTGESLPHAAI